MSEESAEFDAGLLKEQQDFIDEAYDRAKDDEAEKADAGFNLALSDGEIEVEE